MRPPMDDRLRAVVDAARAFVSAQEFPDRTAEQDEGAWDRLVAALAALDGSDDMAGQDTDPDTRT